MIPWDFQEGTKLWSWRNSYWLQYSCLNQLLSSFQQLLHYCAVLHWDTLKSAHTLMHQSVNGSHGILKEMQKFDGEIHIGFLVCSVYHVWINNSPSLFHQQLLDCCAAFPRIHWKLHTFWGINQWMDPICSFRQTLHFDGVIHVWLFLVCSIDFMSGSTPKVICSSCLS